MFSLFLLLLMLIDSYLCTLLYSYVKAHHNYYGKSYHNYCVNLVVCVIILGK